jgi:hypothetical protein
MVRVKPCKHIILRSVELGARYSPISISIGLHHSASTIWTPAAVSGAVAAPLALIVRNGAVRIVVPARKALGGRSVEFSASDDAVFIGVSATQKTAAAGLSLVLRLRLGLRVLLGLRGASDGGDNRRSQARHQNANAHEILLRGMHGADEAPQFVESSTNCVAA